MSWHEDHDRVRPPALPKNFRSSRRARSAARCTVDQRLAAARHARAMAAPIVGRQEKTILFDVSKRELFTPNQGLKGLRRKLGSQFTIAVNKDAITLAVLREASVFAIVGPREKFSAAEFEAMNEYMKEGGSIFITLGEEGESKFATNVNYFCEEYGIAFNQDAVVRTVYYKYLHPKEVHIANGVLNREINVASGRRPRAASAATGALVPPAISESSPQANLSFVYPYGCSLAVQKPAFPVLSSGPLAFPLNRPVCALWSGERARAGAVSGALGGGRLCVLGSSYVLQDDWVDKEENGKLVNVLLRWLTHDGGVTMDSIDADDPDVAEYHQLPDSEALAERVRCFLEETEEVESTACNCSPRRSPPPHRCAAVSRRQRRSRRTSRRSSTTRCSSSTPLSSLRL
jgi:intraflagellar transport protein 52